MLVALPVLIASLEDAGELERTRVPEELPYLEVERRLDDEDSTSAEAELELWLSDLAAAAEARQSRADAIRVGFQGWWRQGNAGGPFSSTDFGAAVTFSLRLDLLASLSEVSPDARPQEEEERLSRCVALDSLGGAAIEEREKVARARALGCSEVASDGRDGRLSR